MSDMNRFDPEKAPITGTASYGDWLADGVGPAVEEGQDMPSDLTNMGAVNVALLMNEARGQLLPGFFEIRPEDLRLFSKEGEL